MLNHHHPQPANMKSLQRAHHLRFLRFTSCSTREGCFKSKHIAVGHHTKRRRNFVLVMNTKLVLINDMVLLLVMIDDVIFFLASTYQKQFNRICQLYNIRPSLYILSYRLLYAEEFCFFEGVHCYFLVIKTLCWIKIFHICIFA